MSMYSSDNSMKKTIKPIAYKVKVLCGIFVFLTENIKLKKRFKFFDRRGRNFNNGCMVFNMFLISINIFNQNIKLSFGKWKILFKIMRKFLIN